MKDVFKKLALLDAGKVLDAATGRGEFIQIIKQSFKSYSQIIGIDASEKAIQYAQKLYPENNIEIFRMDLRDIHFEDGYFDTVCISNSLHHLADMDATFSELLRVLKPGGLLVVTEMYRDGSQAEAQKTHIMMHHWIAGIDRLGGIHHQETFTKQEIVSMIKALPCNDFEIEDFYFPVDNPKESKNCENLLKNCKDTLKRLKSMDNSENLIQEGKLLIERINTIGCASASRLLITAFKS